MREEAENNRRRVADLRRELDSHKEAFIKHVNEDQLRWDRLLVAQEANTKSIEALTHATQGLVDAWSAASAFQRFIKWLSGFALLGAGITWFVSKFPS